MVTKPERTVGNLVRLNNGDVAVVLKANPADPYKPRVRVLIGADGVTLERPYDINLWESIEGQPSSIQAPLDPSQYSLDPLSYL